MLNSTNINSQLNENGKYNLYRNSIIDSLIHASNNNECTLYFRTNSRKELVYSYNDMWKGAMAFAQHVKEKGLNNGDKVVIVMNTSPEYIFSFYGVLLAGGIPIPAAPPALGLRDLNYYMSRINSILDNSEAKFITAFESDIVTFQQKLMPDKQGYKFISVDNIDFIKDVNIDYYEPKLDDICFIQYTSGSTNEPKGVPLTHKNILANIEGIGKAINVTTNESGLSWLPLYHDMGLIGGMLLPMHYMFNKLVLMSPMLLAKPLYWLKYITEYKSTISPGNNFAYKICVNKISEEDIRNLDLSSWRVAFNGSEPIDPIIINNFCDKFKSVGFKKSTMLPCYGLAEATLGVTFPAQGQEPFVLEFDNDNLFLGAKVQLFNKENNENKISRRLLSLGKPMDCLEVKIFNTDNEELPEGNIGRICIKGSCVMSGYYNKDSSEHFLHDGWLKTGDIGFIHDGNLYFTGREKELVIIRGKNYSAVDIENVIKNAEGEDVFCVAFSYFDAEKGNESLGIVFETDLKDDMSIEMLKSNIQKALLNTMQIRAEKIISVPAKSIPKTFNGKVRRLECVNLYSRT